MLPPRTASFSGQIPVRFEGAPGSPLEGKGLWRGVRDFEHGTLCRTFGLDPHRFFFDLPSTVRGIGPNQVGRGRIPTGRRRINGYVMMTGRNEPVGKLSICFDAERFRDDDPGDRRDFFDLSHS